MHQDDDPGPENRIASAPQRIAAITRATYQRKIDNLIRAARERMSVLKMDGDPSSRDLIDQLFTRALFLRTKSFQNERLILLRHIRATDQNPDVLHMCDLVASLKMEAIESEGLTIALRWGDRLKEVSPLSLAEIRADKKRLDDLTHRKTKEIASLLRVMTAAGPADLALAPAAIKEVAALMGHANIRSAGVYGARIKRPKRSEREIPVAELARLGIAAPSKQNVDFVYTRAIRMQKNGNRSFQHNQCGGVIPSDRRAAIRMNTPGGNGSEGRRSPTVGPIPQAGAVTLERFPIR